MSRDNSFGFSSPNSVPSESFTFLTAPALCSAAVHAEADSGPHGAEQAPLSQK